MSSKPKTPLEHSIKSILANATKQIQKQLEDDTAETDARILLQHCLHQSHSYLLTWPEKTLSKEEFHGFQKLLSRRLIGEPIAYIIGHREFWSMDLKVTSDTLIPRPETELLVELALARIAEDNLKILDMGTGSGAIALAIASEKPNCQVTASDISSKALLVAKENAETFDLENICFIQSDWGDKISQQKFNIIISNPPYIEENDPHLKQGDLRFEPDIALSSKLDGLADLIQIVKFAKQRLMEGGCLLLEHGFDQHLEVLELLEEHGFSDLKFYNDIFGNIRVSGGTLFSDGD